MNLKIIKMSDTPLNKRDKKAKFKSIKDKLKSRGFAARVALEDKQSVSTYLNEEFQSFVERVTD